MIYPYGTTECRWDNIIPFAPLWEEYNRVIKSNGAIVLFAAQPFTTKLIESNLKKFRYCWYWKKNNITGFAYARYQPMRCIEDVVVFYSKKPTYNPQGLVELKKPIAYKPHSGTIYPIRGKKAGGESKYTNYPRHLLEFDNEAVNYKKRFHPTQKPVALLEYLIKTYTHEGETVLDNCMGSGSTGVACVNTGRNFIGMELNADYFNTALKRIAEAQENNAQG